MIAFRILTLAVMATFYIAYFAKQISQRRQGVNTMILGKGNKQNNQKQLEIVLKIATFSMPAVEFVSILWDVMECAMIIKSVGVAVAAVGVIFFIAGMLTMKGNWRAGIPEKKETTLVTGGIYSISRNPAFVGFDLMYLGILIAFPNACHAIAVAVSILLFHKQILGEEKFLEEAFGKEYINYKKRVNRYV